MRHVVFDFETFLSRPGNQTPAFVCCSILDEARDQPELYHCNFQRDGLFRRLKVILEDPDTLLIAHNFAYDAVIAMDKYPELIPLFFKKMDEGKVSDTMIRELLITLAQGRFEYDFLRGNRPPMYSLQALAFFYLSVQVDKANSPRKEYSKLWNVPIEDWTPEQIDYSVADAIMPMQVWDMQTIRWAAGDHALHPFVEDDGFIVNEREQVQAFVALYLARAWGVRTDKKRVTKLREHHIKVANDAISKLGGFDPLWLESMGYTEDDFHPVYELNADGRRAKKQGEPLDLTSHTKRTMANLRQYVIDAYDGDPPLTKGGMKLKEEGEPIDLLKKTATSVEVCTSVKHPVLNLYGDVYNTIHELNNFVPLLEKGTLYPINTRYHGLKKTGRTSASKPALQALPRAPGVRECFAARPGYAFVFSDYDSLEVRTWAQCCLELLGWSTAADRYKEDPDFDPHSETGANIIGSDYDSMLEAKRLNYPCLKRGPDEPRCEECFHCQAKDGRQLAKVPNFGLPGGMGWRALIDFAWATYRIELSDEKAERIYNIWYETYPEADPYFDIIGHEAKTHRSCTQVISGRQRGGCGYCDLANSRFQGLAADVCKEALYQLSKEGYAVPDSPFYGSRPWAFVHDEVGSEVPLENLHGAAMRQVEVLVEAGKKWCPDVPLTADVAAMTNWSKSAYKVTDDHGKIIPFVVT